MMSRGQRSERFPSDEDIRHLLNHIHSLGIASREQIGGGNADRLMHRGYIRQVWIDSYALTDEGERVRAGRG